MSEELNKFEEQLNEGNELEILFPDYELKLGTGETVKIKPVSMLHTTKILTALRRLLVKYRELSDRAVSTDGIIQEMLSDCLDEILHIAPLCISSIDHKDSGETVLDRIGPTDTPKVLNIIIRQNFHPDVLGNWTTLVMGIRDLVPQSMLQEVEEESAG